ncbi:MAG: nucleotidyl transferase AbiEii/AbiGii toxin family protein, partial [Candidatus Omnitrophica bacterium]|nr:nucleotidyl transferase AbiEii/AbiGii toxin family protein [Candidatus Omnitrophota bacterium]
MDNVANLSSHERSDLFEQTAANLGLHQAIAEKDFWVCWSLMKLFESSELAGNLVFKGGTSLSKAHHLIDRFSEDIDLVLNWELLGYGKGAKNPWQTMESNTQLDKFNDEFNKQAANYIGKTLLPTVQNLVSSCQAVHVDVPREDPHVIAI